jgi:ATP-dependent metalloprotease
MNGRGEHERVIETYENFGATRTEGHTAEYLKALVAVDRVNESALARAVHRGSVGVGAEEVAGSGAASAASAASSAAPRGILASLSAAFGGESGAVVVVGRRRRRRRRLTVLGSEKNPLYTQQLEPTFKAQLWRTVRTLGTAFIVLSGIGALLEDRGGMGKAILGGESVKPQQNAHTTKFSDVKGVDEAKG